MTTKSVGKTADQMVAQMVARVIEDNFYDFWDYNEFWTSVATPEQVEAAMVVLMNELKKKAKG